MRAVRALIWEQWRQTWALTLGFLVGLLALNVFCGTLIRIYPKWDDPAGAAAGITFAAMVGYVVCLLVTQSDVYNVSVGFPRRLYRLPVTTRTLVLSAALYRAVILALLAGILLAIFYICFHDARVVAGLSLKDALVVGMCIELGAVCGLLCLQAIVWFLGGYNLIVTAGGVVATLICLAHYGKPASGFLHAHPWFCFGASIVAAFGVMLAGVSFDRRGGWQDVAQVAAALRDLVRWPGLRRGRFASSGQAQAWFEWRRKGLLLPGFTLMYATLFALLFLADSTVRAPWLAALGLDLLFALFPAAFTTGLVLFVQQIHDDSSGVTRYLATRPMGSTGFAMARFRGVGWSALATVVAVYAVMAAGALSVPDINAVGAMRNDLWDPIIPKILIPTVWALLWCATGVNMILLFIVWLPAWVFALVGSVFFPHSHLGDPNSLESIYVAYIVAVLLIGNVLAFRRAWHKGLLQRRTFVLAFAGWTVCILISLIALADREPGPIALVFSTCICAGLLSVSFAPFATIPLAIDRRRHNQAGQKMVLF